MLLQARPGLDAAIHRGWTGQALRASRLGGWKESWRLVGEGPEPQIGEDWGTGARTPTGGGWGREDAGGRWTGWRRCQETCCRCPERGAAGTPVLNDAGGAEKGQIMKPSEKQAPNYTQKDRQTEREG